MKIGLTAAILLLVVVLVLSMNACKSTQIIPPLIMFCTGVGMVIGYYVGKG